ncbi:hypothetical protein ACFOG5_21645 [Pedobacter fastidiosus]|uniref:DUF3999 domain-containing protein n=1 Tax=Pedobacter fastidiosus TaxID=2765361 RepID=A0ABR7KNJ8_9SPHI|nr:hypothetical protein [Pedobacter fastidiosus]MBC6109652.1 hypothetical protein [Pedobacter fastidiosus]
MKHKRNLFATCLFVMACFFADAVSAQKYSVSAKVSPITKSTIYALEIPPLIRSLSKEDLSDFRIFDSKGDEVPYFLNQKPGISTSTRYNDIPIIERKSILNKNSFIIIENTSGRNLNSVLLDVSNSELVKTFNVSGSNNKLNWFGLVSNNQLDGLADAEKTSVQKVVDFPVNNYKYIKIDFNDLKTLPLNILKASTASDLTTNSALQEISSKNYTIKDFPNEKLTRIYFKFNNVQIIDQFAFMIQKPLFYKRNAVLFVNKLHQYKRKTEYRKEAICSFELASTGQNVFSSQQLREKEFFIEIENKDNPPLTVANVKLYQKPIRVVANLDSNETYTIKTGNREVSAPEYDLSYFENTLLNHLSTASIYDVKTIEELKAPNKPKPIWQQGWVMWLGIVLGGVIVVYFSASMLKDLNSK